ncbi:MAG: putative DNA binding domain-containing protein [Euryarchaeota archaeon]|nr:putative DNA binding domain-containing protein [Euryarchaeota archaeon]
MDKDEIIALLGKHEWNDLEFKKGQRGIPAETYKTVSAFANTKGGWIVFGVKDDNGKLDIVGVLDIDRVQNDFLGVLRSGTKFNHIITAEEDLISHEGRAVLVFYIPESPRYKKPVFLNGNWNECYVRSGGCDQKCSEEEIKRFIRDSSDVKYDGEPVFDIDYTQFFDEASVKYYRNRYNDKNPGRSEGLSDVDFLSEFGFIVEKEGKSVPTRAGVLIFGKDRYVRRILNNRIVVDYQRIDLNYDDWSPEIRWHDRVVIEGNLIQAWIMLVEKYSRMAERPFSIDKSSLRRHDEPPDYISFREATINLLIHQDYGDHGRKSSIKFYKDRTVFWNPGDSYADEKELLETTGKEVRNPSIVSAFRRIGLSEQAGSGVPSIFDNWGKLGNVPPVINNYKDRKAFELILLKDRLLTDDQILFQKEIGLNLSRDEALVFAFACRNDSISLTDVRALVGKKWQVCRHITDNLSEEGFIREINNERFELAESLKESLFIEKLRLGDGEGEGSGGSKEGGEKLVGSGDASGKTDLDVIESGDNKSAEKGLDTAVTGSEPETSEKLTELEYKVLSACEVPRSTKELLKIIGFKDRGYSRKKIIIPLIDRGILEMTLPEKPSSPDQKYVATEKGLNILTMKITN